MKIVSRIFMSIIALWGLAGAIYNFINKDYGTMCGFAVFALAGISNLK